MPQKSVILESALMQKSVPAVISKTKSEHKPSVKHQFVLHDCLLHGCGLCLTVYCTAIVRLWHSWLPSQL